MQANRCVLIERAVQWILLSARLEPSLDYYDNANSLSIGSSK